MSEELKPSGKNGYGEAFWTLRVPDEYCTPGLEVSICAGEKGVSVGGRLVPWSELDKVRAAHPAPESVGGVEVELLELLREMVDLHERRGTVLTVQMEQLRALLEVKP